WIPGAGYPRLSITPYLETQPLGVFRLGYGRLGPTEARLALLGLLVAIALRAHASLPLLRETLTVVARVRLHAAGAMTLAGGARARANLRVLALREPVVRQG